ncbi:MAG: exodeoxyribonuclease VII large subunit, partial [Proteobacteria bacterium]|nr:exodeoxyribonuclease VII large subunit [Pseudomonadota bacterium]
MKVAKAKPKVAPPEPVVLSVSGLAAAVRDRLEGEFGRVVVQGELSGGKLHSSGHFYCDLKDDEAVLNAVAWRSAVAKWSEIPANGTLVVATGKLTTYAKRSNYQLMIEKIELAGLGALMQQLEALKKRLLAEGLFDADKKRRLPFLPRRVGIVTSPTGAVIGDMLHRIAARCPREVLLWPVAVQGASAAEEVAAAVGGLNALPIQQRPDVIIVARGGGNFEDLMP